jgi:hypothetical protein
MSNLSLNPIGTIYNCQFITKHFFKVKSNYKKNIVFYTSVYVDEKCQDILKCILKKYNALEQILPDIKLQIISFNTHSSVRTSHLEEAELIVYVCGSAEEIEKLSKPIEIGKTEWDHEYNKIHSGKYQSKTINLCFNVASKKAASVLDKTSYRNMTHSTNLDNQTPMLTIETLNMTAKCLNLPEENMEFIRFIFPDHEAYGCLTNRQFFTHQYKLRPFYSLFTCFSAFYKRILKKFKRTYYTQNNYELYSAHVVKKISNTIARDIHKYLIEHKE